MPGRVRGSWWVFAELRSYISRPYRRERGEEISAGAVSVAEEIMSVGYNTGYNMSRLSDG